MAETHLSRDEHPRLKMRSNLESCSSIISVIAVDAVAHFDNINGSSCRPRCGDYGYVDNEKIPGPIARKITVVRRAN